MDKPTINSFSTLIPLFVQKYERYLPNAFDDSLSILEKMNKIIDYLNQIGEISNDVVSQWNTVMEWIKSNGLSDTVNAGIQAKIDDGTLGNLINNSLIKTALQSVSNTMNQITTIFNNLNSETQPFYNADYLQNQIILMASYGGLQNSPANFELYSSKDGITFQNINLGILFSSQLGEVWDYQTLFKDGYFYFLFDQGNKIGFIKTNDFVSYEEHEINLSGFVTLWAPKWFIDDNGDIYIHFAGGDGTNQNDINNQSIPFHKIYAMKATDTTMQNYGTPYLLSFSDSVNKIDPFVIKSSDVYHLFAKNEYNKKIQHWTNSTLSEGSQWTFIQEIDFGIPVEAPALISYLGKWYLYVDAYGDGVTLAKTSIDLNVWSNSFRSGAENQNITRHFQPCVITDSNALTTIKNLIVREQKKNNVKIGTSSQVFRPYQYIERPLDGFVANSIGQTGNIPKLTVVKNGIYSANAGMQITIENLDISALRNFDKFYFVLNSSEPGAHIRIKQSTNFYPSQNFYDISPRTGNNNLLIPFINYNGQPRAMNQESGFDILPFDIWELETMKDGSNNVQNLKIENGNLYRLQGDSPCFIQSLDLTDVPERAIFYFLCASSTTSLTINSSTGIYLPGDTDLILSPTDKTNNKIIKVIKLFNQLYIGG